MPRSLLCLAVAWERPPPLLFMGLLKGGRVAALCLALAGGLSALSSGHFAGLVGRVAGLTALLSHCWCLACCSWGSALFCFLPFVLPCFAFCGLSPPLVVLVVLHAFKAIG